MSPTKANHLFLPEFGQWSVLCVQLHYIFYTYYYRLTAINVMFLTLVSIPMSSFPPQFWKLIWTDGPWNFSVKRCIKIVFQEQFRFKICVVWITSFTFFLACLCSEKIIVGILCSYIQSIHFVPQVLIFSKNTNSDCKTSKWNITDCPILHNSSYPLFVVQSQS